MKKLLAVLLGVSLILSACGKDTSDEKKEKKEEKEEVLETEEVLEKFADLDWDDVEELFSDAGYVGFEEEDGLIKSDDIDEEVIDMDDLLNYIDLEGSEFYYVSQDGRDNGFYAALIESDDETMLTYSLEIVGDDVEFEVYFMNSDFESIELYFVLEDGELVLEDDLDDLSDEEKEYFDDNEDDIVEFFEDAIDEIRTVIK